MNIDTEGSGVHFVPLKESASTSSDSDVVPLATERPAEAEDAEPRDPAPAARPEEKSSPQDAVGPELEVSAPEAASTESEQPPRTVEPAAEHPHPQAGEVLTEILGKIAELERGMRVVSAASKKSAESIDELISENSELRRGALDDMLTPIRNALIRHYDIVNELLAARPANDLEHVRAALLDVLEDVGIRHVETRKGDEPTRDGHRVLGTIDAAEASFERRIAVVVRERFDRADGRVLRPADVRVFRVAQEESAALPDESTRPQDDPPAEESHLDEQEESHV